MLQRWMEAGLGGVVLGFHPSSTAVLFGDTGQEENSLNLSFFICKMRELDFLISRIPSSSNTW